MQQVSDTYMEIAAGEHRKEVRLSFNGAAPENGYAEDQIISLATIRKLFKEDTPSVGNTVSGEIELEMLQPDEDIPRQAMIRPYVRITDGRRYSEWIQKGEFFIDTRSTGTGIRRLSIHGYDAMLKAEQPYPESRLDWPARDLDVVREIAAAMGVRIDYRTVLLLQNNYQIQYPAEYTCREVLGYIAAMYGGNFIINDMGELHLVLLKSIPAETRYLVLRTGEPITFGGVRILV